MNKTVLVYMALSLGRETNKEATLMLCNKGCDGVRSRGTPRPDPGEAGKTSEGNNYLNQCKQNAGGVS